MFECKCEECRNACRHKPGWFAPGEAEHAAALKKMSLKDFFNKFLKVDFFSITESNKNEIDWNSGTKDIYVLSPKIKTESGGGMTEIDPLGECVFFEDGLCSIHAAKPLECGQMSCQSNDDPYIPKRVNAKNWNEPEHQLQVEKLLGCKPEAPEPSIFEALNLLSKRLGGL